MTLSFGPSNALKTKKDQFFASDEQLVEAAKAGHLGAFEELVARHRHRIYARAFSIMRNEDEAMILSQEAFVESWRRLKQFKGGCSYGKWILKIVVNLCLNHSPMSKRQHSDSTEEISQELGDAERQMPVVLACPTERLERSGLRNKIDQALGQLSFELRTVLVLHEFEKLDYDELGEAMGCSINTVMLRLLIARRKMAVMMADSKTGDLT